MFLPFVLLLIIFKISTSKVPPAACTAKPRFEDCGGAPTPVMYYYKPGSRCEVGFWRGCYPNLNMFKDEYECSAKCIFGSRAESKDYHSFDDIYGEEPEDKYSGLISSGNGTKSGNNTNTNGTETEGQNQQEANKQQGEESQTGAGSTPNAPGNTDETSPTTPGAETPPSDSTPSAETPTEETTTQETATEETTTEETTTEAAAP